MYVDGTGASFGSIEHGASFLTMKKTMDSVEMQMAGLIDMMEKSNPPRNVSLSSHLGQNFDMRV